MIWTERLQLLKKNALHEQKNLHADLIIAGEGVREWGGIDRHLKKKKKHYSVVKAAMSPVICKDSVSFGSTSSIILTPTHYRPLFISPNAPFHNNGLA